MKRTVAIVLAMALLLSGIQAFAEEEKTFKIAPTVEMRNGVAYSTNPPERATTDYQITYPNEPALVADKDGNIEHVLNRSFEFTTNNLLNSWSDGNIVGGKLNEKGAFLVEDAKSGKQALRFAGSSDENFHAVQEVRTVVGGEEYELSAWCKRTSGKAILSFMAYYLDKKDRVAVEFANHVDLDFNEAPVGEWTQRTAHFTLPEETTYFTVMVGMMDGGELIFDDISVVGPALPLEKVVMPPYTPPDDGMENMIKDGSFEDDDEFDYTKQTEEVVGAWFTRSGVYDGMYSYTEEEAHSGKRSVRLKFDRSTSMPWFGQTVEVEPETTYQFSAWVKVGKDSKEGVKLQADAYIGGPEQTNEHYSKDGQRKGSFYVDAENTDWQHVVCTFTTHTDTTHYCLMLRAFAEYPYNMFFDDVELYPIGKLTAKMRRLEPDQVFYYSDWVGEGNAVLTTYIDQNPQLVGAPVRFQLKDGDRVILEEIKTLSEEGGQTFYYPLELLSEKKKEYAVTATLLDSANEPTGNTLTRYIYKYDRPTMLDETQRLLDAEGERVEHYILAQGTVEEIMWRVPEVGATVGRAIGSGRTSRTEKLDIAYQAGMKATVTLYNHKDISDPAVLQHVIDTINQVKDHPALIGWYLWEEPSFRGDGIDLQEDLRVGAKLIRDMDPKHPLLGVISVQKNYGEFAKYCDMMDLDCYPAQIYDGKRIQYIANNVASAMEQTNWQKPISIMNQAFNWFGYKPTWEQLRNYIYQSFFEGANGFSFHTFGREGSGGDTATAVKLDDEIWKKMEEADKWEYDFMFDHFTLLKNPLFNEARNEDVRWRTLVVGDDLYAIVLNMWENDAKTADIPLSDFTGKITVSGAKAELVAGGDSKTIEISGDTFHVDVEPFQAAVYKITPNTPTDFSSVKPSRFRDLYNHIWARDAIIMLDEKGICNDLSAVAYAPSKNITRGDFAMFLVRTLGLTAEATENFADVKDNREYAKDLAIGKAAGILNGVGDNKFNPEAQISRQDMMTMIGRGMQLTGESDLTAFADSSQIADYALAHVKAMISSGLIKGNADGTLNPLGNTTRAEAAVIMQRILNR